MEPKPTPRVAPMGLSAPGTIQGFFTTREIMTRFNWTRQQVSSTARREHWRFSLIGNAKIYHYVDVMTYAEAREATAILRKLGWHGRGLLRNTDSRFTCPICYASAYVYNGKWLCCNDHGGNENGLPFQPKST